MAIRRSSVVWTGVMLLAMGVAVSAQNGRSTTNQGSTPNGKPFQYIQQRLAELHARINGVESSLQAQINGIETQVVAMHVDIVSLQDAVASVETRIAANELTIAALNGTVASLQSLLSAVHGELAELQAQSPANADISALQSEYSQLQVLVEAHTAQIASLQQQTNAANQFLANMVNATCSAGQAFNDVLPSGSITCVTAGGGGSPTETHSQSFSWNLGAGTHTLHVGCPSNYTAVGGGYNGGSSVEVVQYVSAANLTVAGLEVTYGSFFRNAMSILAAYPNTNRFTVNAEYRPHASGTKTSMFVYAKCVKTS